jgi:hypothetical protein
MVRLSHESPDDERLRDLIASLEFPLSVLRAAPVVECRCASPSERVDALGGAKSPKSRPTRMGWR